MELFKKDGKSYVITLIVGVIVIISIGLIVYSIDTRVRRHGDYWQEGVYHLTELEMVANGLDIQKEVTIKSPSIIVTMQTLEDFMDKAREINTSVVYSSMLYGRVPPFHVYEFYGGLRFFIWRVEKCHYSYYIFNEPMTIAYRYTLKIERIEPKLFSEFRRVN